MQAARHAVLDQCLARCSTVQKIVLIAKSAQPQTPKLGCGGSDDKLFESSMFAFQISIDNYLIKTIFFDCCIR